MSAAYPTTTAEQIGARRKALQAAAHQAVHDAIVVGELRPASDFRCSDCPRPANAYDHRDYRKPMDVVPVCTSCNFKRGPGLPWAPRSESRRFRKTGGGTWVVLELSDEEVAALRGWDQYDRAPLDRLVWRLVHESIVYGRPEILLRRIDRLRQRIAHMPARLRAFAEALGGYADKLDGGRRRPVGPAGEPPDCDPPKEQEAR